MERDRWQRRLCFVKELPYESLLSEKRGWNRLKQERLGRLLGYGGTWRVSKSQSRDLGSLGQGSVSLRRHLSQEGASWVRLEKLLSGFCYHLFQVSLFHAALHFFHDPE